MQFIFDTRNNGGGGGGGDGVTNVGTGNGLTGGPITTTGVISLAQVPAGNLLANLTGSTDDLSPSSLPDIFDYVFDDTQGDILFRAESGWTYLAPGTAGQVLVTGGPDADPSWAGGTGGTVTEIDTGTGLTGGPITTTGTISFATIPTLELLANLTGGTAAPLPHTMTSIFDAVLGNTQGDILYRNGTVWTVLAPGTAGQVLETGGASANPSWTNAGGGSVTNIATGTGLTGGPITTTGTISFAPIASLFMLANITGSSAAPLPHSVSDVLDAAFNDTQGNILYRNASEWSYLTPGTAGYFLSTGGPGQNPSWQPGGGGGGSDHAYVGAQWGAQNGSAGFNGVSINAPKLGVQAMITALPNGGAINIPDDGTYTGNLVFTAGQNYVINALGATLNSNSGTFLTISGGSTVIIHCYDFTCSDVVSIDSSSNLYIFSHHMSGNMTTDGDTYLYVTGYEGNITSSKRLYFQFDLMAGSIADTSADAGVPNCYVFGRLVGGNISSTNGLLAGNVSEVNGSVSGVWEGVFNNVHYGLNQLIGNPGYTVSNQIFNITTSLGNDDDYTVQALDSNGVIGIYNTTGTLDITLPDVTTLPGLYNGWRCYAWQGYDGGGARFLVEGNDILHTNTGPFTREGLVTIILTSNSQDPDVGRIWTLSGEVAGSGSIALTGFPSISIDSPVITHTSLASAGKVNIINAPLSTSQFKISNILVSGVGATSFSGIAGDRNLVITDGTNVWTTIPAAILQAISGTNAVWGSASVPLPTTIPLNQTSVAGNDIYAQYDGGTTDYTAGSFEITLDYERITI